MSFQLRPQIYSLLLCSDVTPNEETGGWRFEPFSHIAVRQMPVDLAISVVAHIMAPPGEYSFTLRLFHSTESGQPQVLPPRAFVVQEGKNFDFMLHIEATISQLGLHIVEAGITGHHTTYAPLRISQA